MYVQLVLSMADGLSDQENEQKRLLDEVKLQLQEKRDLCLRNEGHFSAYSGFYKELDQLNKELEVLKTSPDPREVDRKEVEVTTITKMLSRAGATIDSGRLKEDLDSLQQKNIALEFELKALTSQRAFMDTAVQYIQEKGRGIIVPSPPTKASVLNPFVCIESDCVACGEPFSTNHMAVFFSLECQHKYHPFCFAVLCGTMAECTYPLSTVKIPKIAKCWALGIEYTEPEETNADKSSHVPELDENIKKLLELDKSNIELSEGFQHGKVVVKNGNRVEDPEAKPFVVENHGKETIGQDSSKLSTDNQEGSLEIANKVEDAEDVETLLIIADTLRKKRKRQQEEGVHHPDPKKIKIQVIGNVGHRHCAHEDLGHFDRETPLLTQFRVPHLLEDNRPALIININDLLIVTHNKGKGPSPPNVDMLHFRKVKQDDNLIHDVHHFAEWFVLGASQIIEVYVWNTSRCQDLEKRLKLCLPQIRLGFMDSSKRIETSSSAKKKRKSQPKLDAFLSKRPSVHVGGASNDAESVARFQEIIPRIMGVHCIAHRQALAAKDGFVSHPHVYTFVDKVANKVYSWLGKSAKRHTELWKIMSDYDIIDAKALQIRSMRWLSRGHK
ncbi:hypothetical protein L7F22_056107 [Adiantum nelumboides]|nr:hypothetical protein [Adiantum nelumboides]